MIVYVRGASFGVGDDTERILEVFHSETPSPGWYWWPRRPGDAEPDAVPSGPFDTSNAAFGDADQSQTGE